MIYFTIVFSCNFRISPRMRELANLQRNGGDQVAAVDDEAAGVAARDLSGAHPESLSETRCGYD